MSIFNLYYLRCLVLRFRKSRIEWRRPVPAVIIFTPNVLLKSALHVTSWVERGEFLCGAMGKLVIKISLINSNVQCLLLAAGG